MIFTAGGGTSLGGESVWKSPGKDHLHNSRYKICLEFPLQSKFYKICSSLQTVGPVERTSHQSVGVRELVATSYVNRWELPGQIGGNYQVREQVWDLSQQLVWFHHVYHQVGT